MRNFRVGVLRPTAQVRAEQTPETARNNQKVSSVWLRVTTLMDRGACCCCWVAWLVAKGAGRGVDHRNGDRQDRLGGCDADVKLTDTRTGATYTSKTGTFGAYLFSRVSAGSGYSVSVSKAGFKTTTISKVTLAVTETATYDVTLELGSVSESVEVSASAGITLNTTDATIGNDIDTRRVAELPSLFRTMRRHCYGSRQVLLVSGRRRTRTGQPTRVGDRFARGSGKHHSRWHGRERRNHRPSVYRGGLGTHRLDRGGPHDGGRAGAGFGRSSGGQINLVTKSGTNAFHGSLHEYNRNTLFAANDFFNNKNGVSKPPLNRNQFGGSIGGPILRDKLFFFFNYEAAGMRSLHRFSRSYPATRFATGS